MSRESNFISDLVSKTEDGEIKWVNTQPSRYSEYVFQGHLAYQAFEATILIKRKKYKVALVHKKVPTHNVDFEIVEEKHGTDLLVFLDGRLVSTITQYEVDDKVLTDLSEAVAARNDDVDDLFSSYE